MFKKKSLVIIIFLLSISLFGHYKYLTTVSAKRALAKSAIRFHVLANSDTTIDQNLKMQVKENVVNYIYQGTRDFTTLEQSKDFLLNHSQEIATIASNTIKSLGFDYSVSTNYGKSYFPDKTYGDVVFPKGLYTSYTITIGKGKGHNWWCVLYPPLCFVDASTGIVPDDSKELLKENLSETEYSSIIKFRFKYLTFLNKYIS